MSVSFLPPWYAAQLISMSSCVAPRAHDARAMKNVG
jgi:hypothetical protein